MNVDEIYRRQVVVAQMGERLSDAAAMMRYHDVGALPVYEHGECVGIITERDLAQAMADGSDPLETRVWRYMTPGPVRVWMDSDARDAIDLMIALHARHLPVTDGDTLVGMLSMRDVMRALVARNRADQSI